MQRRPRPQRTMGRMGGDISCKIQGPQPEQPGRGLIYKYSSPPTLQAGEDPAKTAVLEGEPGVKQLPRARIPVQFPAAEEDIAQCATCLEPGGFAWGSCSSSIPKPSNSNFSRPAFQSSWPQSAGSFSLEPCANQAQDVSARLTPAKGVGQKPWMTVQTGLLVALSMLQSSSLRWEPFPRTSFASEKFNIFFKFFCIYRNCYPALVCSSNPIGDRSCRKSASPDQVRAPPPPPPHRMH